MDNKLSYSVEEFCREHSISRAFFYKLIAAGKGPRVMKLGARTFVSAEAARAWRECVERETAAERAAG